MENVRVFAKLGTNEKIIIYCSYIGMLSVLNYLCNKYGGEWSFIGSLKEEEYIKFSDTIKYEKHNLKQDKKFDSLKIKDFKNSF